MGEENKVITSPPQGDGLRPHSCSLPRLRPWVTRIKLQIHHLGEVACELNLAFTQAEALGDANKVVTSPPQGGGFRAQSHSLPGLMPWLT